MCFKLFYGEYIEIELIIEIDIEINIEMRLALCQTIRLYHGCTQTDA